MKRYLQLLSRMRRAGYAALAMLFAATYGPALAKPPASASNNDQVRSAAATLFRANRASDAVAYLLANIQSSPKPNAHTIDVGLQLCELALQFRGEKNLVTGRSVVQQAITLAMPLLSSTHVDSDRATLFYNLGFACEVVMHDEPSAAGYYTAALGFEPSHHGAQARLSALKAKKMPKSSQN